ncbi:hypothetical protein ACHAP5_003460 [Fusarium lateritium]
MRPDFAVVLFTLITSTVASAVDGPRHIKRIESEPSVDEHELYKRRGGGGGGGRGGGGGGGKSGGSSSGGSRGSSGSSGSRGGSSGSRGVGPQPSYGGGRYYAGGSATPYRAGGRSPAGRIAPFVLLGGALAFWPGVWLYGAYMYPYHDQYRYHNETSDEDEERDIICACARYAQCACDDNNNTAYYDELIGNGSYQSLNKSVVDVAEVNGTMTILINGTLPNDTALPSDDDSDSDDNGDDSSDSAAARTLIEALGFWPAVAAVMATVFIA